jgi:DNA-binding response OmpR family regulator
MPKITLKGRGSAADERRVEGNVSRSNCEAAWEVLQNSIYDRVILDLNLPRIDGMELLNR